MHCEIGTSALDAKGQREHDDVDGHDPHHGTQQDATHDHGGGQAEPATDVLLVLWKAIGGDRDEDEVVDAECQLEEHEDGDLGPPVGGGEGREETC